MNDTFNYKININIANSQLFAQLNQLNVKFEGLTKAVKGIEDASAKASSSITKSFKNINLDSILNNVDRVATGLSNMAQPGLKLSSSMADLSAITGVTGVKLKEIEGYARSNAKTFGIDAAQAAESFKLVLSQLNPKIAESPEALKAMGSNIGTLSKLMGGNAAAATEVLTTAMNQYQVSTADPMQASAEMAKMMNVMAAASKEGSAELPQIKQALEQAGLAAKSANVSFEEANSAIQVLDKAGKKGAEGGVALRNVLATMSEGRFMPKEAREALQAAGVDVAALGDKGRTLSDRLTFLKPIINDSALLTKVFGKENQNAALALISGTGEMDKYTTAITNTSVATEMAAVVMDSPAEKAARLKQQIEDLKISFFNSTNGALGYVSVLAEVGQTIGNLTPLWTVAKGAFDAITNSQKLMTLWTNISTGATRLFSITLWSIPIMWIILGIVALIAVIYYLSQKFTGWGKLWDYTVKGAKLAFQAYVEYVKWSFNTVVDGIMIGINWIMKKWYQFKEAIGVGGDNADMIAQLDADTERRKSEIVGGAEKIAALSKQSGEAFAAGFSSIKVNDNVTLGSIKKDLTKKLGLDTKKPGDDKVLVPGGDPKDKLGKAGSTKAAQTANSVATGGTKNTVINIQFKNMVESFRVTSATGSFKEAAIDIKDQVQEVLTRVLAGAAATAG